MQEKGLPKVFHWSTRARVEVLAPTTILFGVESVPSHPALHPHRLTRTAQRATIPQQSSFSARRTSSLLCRHARIHKPAGNPSASGDMHRDAMMLNSWLKNGMLQARTNAKAPVVEVMASQCDAARQEPPALAVAGARRTCSALPTIWVAIT